MDDILAILIPVAFVVFVIYIVGKNFGIWNKVPNWMNAVKRTIYRWSR